MYYDRKRFDEAIAEYLTAIRLEPQSADPHNNLGSVYGALQRYDEAIAEYQTALRLDPNNQGIAANLKLAQDAKAQAGK